MVRTILRLYYLFINHWKHFGKLFKFFVIVVSAGASLDLLEVIHDWTQHRLCNIKTIYNVFCIWYLAWFALLMKIGWTFGTQNLIMVIAVVSSWIETGFIFTIKPIELQACICYSILYLNYLPVICWELWYCSIFNKIIYWFISIL